MLFFAWNVKLLKWYAAVNERLVIKKANKRTSIRKMSNFTGLVFGWYFGSKNG